jgi:DNA-binding response OmpR family regulator
VRARILIAEPLRWLRDREVEILIRGGFCAYPAGTFKGALALALAGSPHAVILRYQLGDDGTGVELIAELHKVGLYIPIVGIAGRAQSARMLEGAGARVLRQPFDGRALIATLKTSLGE